MGIISQMEVISDVQLWGLFGWVFPHGSRPLAVLVYEAWQPAFLCLSHAHNGE